MASVGEAVDIADGHVEAASNQNVGYRDVDIVDNRELQDLEDQEDREEEEQLGDDILDILTISMDRAHL